MMTAFLAIIFVAFAGLAWHDFRRALILLFALLPSYLIRFSLGPAPTTALEIFILTLAVVWLTKRWIKIPLLTKEGLGEVVRRSLGNFRIPLLLGLAAACFAAAYAPDIYAALGILKAYYFEPALVLMMLVSTFKERADWYAAFTALTASGVAISLLGITQYATGLGIPAPWNFEQRITSIFDFPNAVGLFLAPIVAALTVSVFSSSKHRVLKLLAIVIMSAAIVLAKTEAAIVAIPAVLLIVLLVSRAKLRTKIVVNVLAVGSFMALAIFVPAVQEKLLLRDISGQARLSMWSETATLLADHPVLGAGLSGFPTAIEPYHDATVFEIFQYPHNVMLNIWVELGLFGLVVFFLFIFTIGKITLQNKNDGAALAVAAALLVMIIHGLVDVPFFKNDLAVMTAGFIAFLAANLAPVAKHV